jgi:DNA polymerase-3 subunit epsilon
LHVRPQGRVNPQSILVHHLREQDLQDAVPLAQAVGQLLRFIGSRPLVGYFLRFDVAMLDAPVRALTGIGLPQPRFEVSALYQRYKHRETSAFARQSLPLDLSLPAMLADLDLPDCPAHDPFNDALMAALAFVKLRHLLGEHAIA